MVVTSVAGPDVDLTLATRSIAPTIAAVSAETAAKLHSTTAASVTGGLKKLAHSAETRALTAGRLPTDTFFSRLNAPTRANIGTTPGKLRLLFVAERAGLNTPPLTSEDLSDIRIYTKARVIYALTAGKVAGAVTQTNLYDYRREATPSAKHSHFGVPLSCLEVKLKDTASHKTTDEKSVGEIVATGASVAGGEVALGVNGTLLPTMIVYNRLLTCEKARSAMTTRWPMSESPKSKHLVNVRDRRYNDTRVYQRMILRQNLEQFALLA